MEYYPTKMMISDLYKKPLQGKLFRLFRNLIINFHEEKIRNITLSEKFTSTEENIEDADRAIAVESVQECIAGNNKVRRRNTGNRDLGSDDINRAVDTCKIILHMKPDLLSRLKSVAAGAA